MLEFHWQELFFLLGAGFVDQLYKVKPILK